MIALPEVHDDRLRVSITDAAADRPEILPPSSDRPRGRGMFLVDALAAAWGVEQHGQGKSVWFELA